jgi:hypothetical protein
MKSTIEEWKDIVSKIKKFTKDECEAMEKSELIKYLLVWQKVAHQAIEIFTKQDEIFDELGIYQIFSNDEYSEASKKHHILFTNSNNLNKFQSIKNDELLIKFSNEYFGHDNTYTINDFDKLCQDTREQLKNNIKFEDTELYKILTLLKNEVIYIWHGSEFNFLLQADSFEELLNSIHGKLMDENGEIYIGYNSK